MIFTAKSTDKNNFAEQKVFSALANLQDADFTAFYRQQFATINRREKNEYEIGFLIADHRNNLSLIALLFHFIGFFDFRMLKYRRMNACPPVYHLIQVSNKYFFN